MPPEESPRRELLAEISSLLFAYSLFFYLILFLLEIIFPGFVTDHFALNYLLIPTVVFGILSTIFPRGEAVEKTTKPASIGDLALLIALTIGSFLLVYYKFEIDDLRMKIAVSGITSVLALTLSVVLMYLPDKPADETEDLSQGAPVAINWVQFSKRVLLSRLRLPVPLAILVVVLSLIFIPRNTSQLLNSPRRLPEPQDSTVTPQAETGAPSQIDLPDPDPNIKILVYNGGAEAGEAGRFADQFRKKGYREVEALDYEENNIDNAQIQFRESEAKQADLIEIMVRDAYSVVNRAPLATSSAEIRVILGKLPVPESEAPLFEDEDLEFFFN